MTTQQPPTGPCNNIALQAMNTLLAAGPAQAHTSPYCQHLSVALPAAHWIESVIALQGGQLWLQSTHAVPPRTAAACNQAVCHTQQYQRLARSCAASQRSLSCSHTSGGAPAGACQGDNSSTMYIQAGTQTHIRHRHTPITKARYNW